MIQTCNQTNFFSRVFVNDTSQFLAPYQASVKSREIESPESAESYKTVGGQLTAAIGTTDQKPPGVSASHVSLHLLALMSNGLSLNNNLIMCFANPFQNELSKVSSLPGSDRAGLSLSEEVADWNPFHERSKPENLSEDQFFGAEFDKIRRGSQSSMCARPSQNKHKL